MISAGRLLIIVAFFALVPVARAGEYRLAAGDVLEMSLVGLADVRQRAPIDIDGKVSLPLVGLVDAAGKTLGELRARVQQLVARRSVRRQTSEGREYAVVIEPDEVTLSVVEYRPVYVNGDVSKPGAVPFRAELTVRQAVSLAGGYDVMRFRITNPFIQAADLEGELKMLTADRVRQQIRVARLEAELANSQSFDAGTSSTAAVSRSFFDEVRTLENEQFQSRMTTAANEKASLQTLIKQGESQLASLGAQRDREQEGVKVDAADLVRLTTLFDRGNLGSNRVTDTRRSLLLSETRLLQTSVEIERVRREREGDLRKLKKLDEIRQLEVAKELQDARVGLVGTDARIQATTNKLLYTATVRSQLVAGTGGHPKILLVRNGGGEGRLVMNADEDTALLPADVIEVSLEADFKPELRKGQSSIRTR